jgi:hypothetical protein
VGLGGVARTVAGSENVEARVGQATFFSAKRPLMATRGSLGRIVGVVG